MTDQFYLRVRGKVVGPYDRDHVAALIDRGKFGRQHEISEDGMTWSRAANYPALFERGTPKKRRSAPAGESPSGQIAGAGTTVTPTGESGTTIGLARDAETSSSRAPMNSAASDGENWHYANDGGEDGPVPFTVLRQMVADGGLRQDDQVWCSTWPDWRPVQDVPELASAPGSGRRPRKPATGGATSFDVPNASLFALLFSLYALSGVFAGTVIPLMDELPDGPTFKLMLSLFGPSGVFVVALIPSIALGHLALRIHREHPTVPGRPYALAGLMISYGILVCVAIIILVLFGISIYNDVSAA